MRPEFVLSVAVSVGMTAAATADTFLFDTPTLDRWSYPFNQEPGTKNVAKIFSPLTDAGFDDQFDNRDGQMLIGFDLSAIDPCGLDVTGAVITVQVQSDESFEYDPTPDPWTSYLLSDDPRFTADPDAGRPVEIFGTGFRNGWTAQTYPENGPFCAGCNCFFECKSVRNTYATDFDGGAPRDVSNNIDDEFDPAPFATGTTGAVAQGEAVPSLTVLTFALDVADPDVQAYLRTALDDGVLMVMIASIFPSDQKVGGTFPELYTRENLLVQIGAAQAATLELTVESTGEPGDIDGNGIVNTVDLLALLAAWGECPVSPPCPADFNCDGVVNTVDLLALLGGWT